MLRRILIATTIAFSTAAYADAPFTAAIVSSTPATVSEPFGPRVNAEGANVFHAGADIAVAPGSAVHAPADGRVVRVHAPGSLNGYTGQVVVIDHGDGVRTRISGLEGVQLAANTRISAGDVMGAVSARDDGVAPHVHVELWRDENVLDPSTQIQLIAAPN
jgi:murein DD-endopeptidase MepM/ murein hydrolase activator NlpD